MPRVYQRKFIDMAGQVIGRLTVVSCVGYNKNGVAIWLCHCACGTDVEVPRRNLVHKKSPTRSCGCLRKEVSAQRMAARHAATKKETATP